MSESSAAGAEPVKKAIPAWKLRESMRQRGPPVPGRNSSIKKKSGDGVDAPLPPAFKTIRKERLAFQKQQARRKNNDTWTSLNSSHPGKDASENGSNQNTAGAETDDDDDSFG